MRRSWSHFWFDPGVPVRLNDEQVGPHGRAQRDYAVEWRFISLRLIAARARALYGPDGVDRFYAACGGFVFERPPTRTPLPELLDAGQELPTVLVDAGLPVELADALDDSSYEPSVASRCARPSPTPRAPSTAQVRAFHARANRLSSR